MPDVALSFVIPLLQQRRDHRARSSTTSRRSTIDGGHEIVLVNDGSADDTSEVCRDLVRTAARADHAHRARAQLRRAQRRAHRLAPRPRRPHRQPRRRRSESAARKRCGCGSTRSATDLDVVFGHYEIKQHSALAERRQLVHEPDDRLGARQAAWLLPFELSLRERVRGAAGRRATPARIRTSTACCCR